MMKRLFYLFCLSLILIACKKPAPQLPSNKGIQADVESEALLKINKELTLKEDSIIKIYCENNTNKFTKNELGFWYFKQQNTDSKLINVKDSCEFELTIMTLEGKTLFKENKKIVIGKKSVFVGLEEGLKIMRKGEHATFVFPWYLGYGMKGYNSIIQPYTSLLCEVKLNN